eukprot:5413243-Prymnesium_polylepis.1
MPSASVRWHSCSCHSRCLLPSQMQPEQTRFESVVPAPRPSAPKHGTHQQLSCRRAKTPSSSSMYEKVDLARSRGSYLLFSTFARSCMSVASE